MSLKLLKRKTRSKTGAVKCGPIGIDFALNAIHAIQLGDKMGDRSLYASASIDYPTSRTEAMQSPRELSQLLRKLTSAQGFSGRDVVVALPNTETKILPIQYQATREEFESKVILDQLKERLPEPLTHYVIDYVPVRQDSRDGQRLALVAVAERRMVMELLNTFRRARLNPIAMEVGPIAIRRLIASMFLPGDLHNVLVVNIGQKHTYLTMISGRRLLMNQSIEIGQQKLLQAVASKLDTTIDEALATVTRCGLYPSSNSDDDVRDRIQTLGLILKPEFRMISDEINQAFRYAASVCRGATGKKIFLSGSILHWPGADRFLSELSSSEIDPLPAALFPLFHSESSVTDSSESLISTGLALRGMVPNE